MATDVLTVGLVQDVQEALRNGQPVSPVVSGLRRATLPGLLEYNCLRWAWGSPVPPLPKPIVTSPLGRSLREVKCDLGLRSTGPEAPPMRRTDARPCGFY